MLCGFFTIVFYRTVSMKVGLVCEELPPFLTFVVQNVIGWLSSK